MGRFIIKHINSIKPQKRNKIERVIEDNKKTNTKVMTTNEKIEMVQEVLKANAPVKAKRLKKDKGLIERTENSKIILTEDNKELLKD
jgi:hypothetical protein